MTNNTSPLLNKNKELLNRLMILEKFIELKSNECAYYRSKVHLIQMSSVHSSIMNKTKRSSSEDISQSSTTSQSQSNRYRTSSLPLSSRNKTLNVSHVSNSSIPFNQSKHIQVSSSRRQTRKEKKIYAQNQNYYEDDCPNEKLSSLINNPNSSKDKNLIDQILISYINKHVQQGVTRHKNTQCNEKDFYPIERSSKSTNTTLIIRLPRLFVQSLAEQQKKSITPKLKVHISSELLNKLLQSIHSNSVNTKKNLHHQTNKFTIQSQFGTISACINHEDCNDIQQCKTVHAKAEIKNQLPIIRHIARTRSDRSDKILHTVSHKHRRKKRHLHKSCSTSQEEIFSKKSSLTSVTQSIKTLPSSP